MKPTTDFRWALVPATSLGWEHPVILVRPTGMAVVLQQRWSSGLVGVPDEWRDIPMVEVGA